MRLTCFAGVEYHNKLIFSAFYFNALCEMDLATREVKLIRLFDKEPMYSRLHRQAFLYQDEAWFIPQRGNYIARVNLHTYEIMYYDVPCTVRNEESDIYQYSVYLQGKVLEERYLCLFPYDVDTIVLLEMQDGKFYQLGSILDKEHCCIGAKKSGKTVELLFNQSRQVLHYNIDTRDKYQTTLNEELCALSSITGKDGVWLIDDTAEKLYCYQNEKLYKISTGTQQDSDLYSGILETENELILLPFKASEFILINKDDCSMKRDNFESPELFAEVANKVTQIASSSGRCMVTMGDVGTVVEFIGGRIEKFPFPEVSDDMENAYFDMLFRENRLDEMFHMVNERKVETEFPLQAYITYVCNQGVEEQDRENSHEMGVKIWNHMKI